VGEGWVDLEPVIDIKIIKNRLLKVCYVPATTAASFKAFFLFIILRPFTVLMRHTRQAVRAIKQFISLDVYGACAPYHLQGCQMSKYPTLYCEELISKLNSFIVCVPGVFVSKLLKSATHIPAK
jgi:hypothetical protein